jgi:hypothetical protein
MPPAHGDTFLNELCEQLPPSKLEENGIIIHFQALQLPGLPNQYLFAVQFRECGDLGGIYQVNFAVPKLVHVPLIESTIAFSEKYKTIRLFARSS